MNMYMVYLLLAVCELDLWAAQSPQGVSVRVTYGKYNGVDSLNR